MSSYVGLSPQNPARYTGASLYLSTIVTRKRPPTGTDYTQPESGKKYPVGSFWVIGPAPTSGTQGDLWYLAKIVSNVATWLRLSTGSSGPLISIDVDASTAPGTDPVVADGTGVMGIKGGTTFATGTQANPLRTNSLTANNFTIESQLAGANAATLTANKFGVAQFDENHFDVAAGFVQLQGGGTTPAVTKLGMQSGTNPVVADATGLITLTGSTATAGTTPVQTVGGTNTGAVTIQRSQAISAADSTKVGLANFDSADFSVDANGWVELKNPATSSSGVSNIGFSYSSPTFTVHGSDGTALSATNPGYVWVQNKANPGRLTRLTVTENYTFTDGTTGTTDNQRFGLVTGVSWGSVLPFFLHCVQHDTPASAPAFAISRNPAATSAPAAASIGVSGAVVNVGQSDWFLLTGATSGVPTVTNYDANPSLLVGSFQATFAGATDSWTVAALGATDGVGAFNEGVIFTQPTGVNGAAASTYWQSTGGTQPQFTSSIVAYSIYRNGWVDYSAELNACNVAGVGANAARLTLPYLWAANTGSDGCYCVYIQASSGIVYLLKATNNATAYLEAIINNGATTANFFLNTQFAANDEFSCRLRFKAF